jgi:hypothetical protein
LFRNTIVEAVKHTLILPFEMSSSTNRQNKKNEIYPHGFLQNGHRKFLNNCVEPAFKMKAEVLLTD